MHNPMREQSHDIFYSILANRMCLKFQTNYGESHDVIPLAHILTNERLITWGHVILILVYYPKVGP